MAQPWSRAASLDRCMVQWRCSFPPSSPCRASVPPPRPRQARTTWRIGCTSVPRELEVTEEQTARPVINAGSDEEEGVECDGCSGVGWLLCDFCKGKKNNVKSEGSRIYRRCPTCKAAGFIMCPRCRVYKCITFPESNVS